ISACGESEPTNGALLCGFRDEADGLRARIAAAQKKTPAARSGRESQSRRCHTNYAVRLRKSAATDNESISISI
ncbi:TPA: hypothetical protein ACXM9F_006798, partial [Burkholderia cenocepacia]